MSKNSAEPNPSHRKSQNRPVSRYYVYRLRGHYLSEGRVITVSHGSRDVVLNTPTPLTAPPIDDHSMNSKLASSATRPPISRICVRSKIRTMDGDWELRPDVAETWKNLEDCLRTVGTVIMANAKMPAPDYSLHFPPGLFRCYGCQYKTPHEARRGRGVYSHEFLPLVGFISMALWYVEDRPQAPPNPRPWWEEVIEQTSLRPEWLDLLKISVAARWSTERIGGLYHVGTANKAASLKTTGMEWLVSSILRSGASIPLYVIWEVLPQSISAKPPSYLQQFAPDNSELQYLHSLPGAVKFRAYERDPLTGAWRPLANDAAMDVDEPSQPTVIPPPKAPKRPPTPPGEFPPVERNFESKTWRVHGSLFRTACQGRRTDSGTRVGPATRGSTSGKKSTAIGFDDQQGRKKKLWDDHSSSQRRYNGFRDEWDLCVKWGPEDPPTPEEEEEFLQDAGQLYPAELLTDLRGPSNNTVKKTLSAYQPTWTGDPDYDQWNMLDEVRVNYYVLRDRGKPLIDSRVLLIESPTDVFEILRQRWGPTIDHVVERLVSRGMSFRLALVSTTIESSPLSPPRHRPVVNVFGGLGFRPQGYEPDMDDYFAYQTQLNYQLLHTRRGFLALQYGGLVARLALPETYLDELLHNLDNGIPSSLTACGIIGRTTLIGSRVSLSAKSNSSVASIISRQAKQINGKTDYRCPPERWRVI
ncbi:hypothetical protein B0H12DRAFT_1240042 [Mycena haematopus]|nr:hypothetical protein B0H12DRAFT_1240042 [Mycena haematopus]